MLIIEILHLSSIIIVDYITYEPSLIADIQTNYPMSLIITHIVLSLNHLIIISYDHT
jgi:hypothetical protein